MNNDAYKAIYGLVKQAIEMATAHGTKLTRGVVALGVTDHIVRRVMSEGKKMDSRLTRKVMNACFKALDEQGYTYGK